MGGVLSCKRPLERRRVLGGEVAAVPVEERGHARGAKLTDLDDACIGPDALDDDDDANGAGQEPVGGTLRDAAKGDAKLKGWDSATGADADDGGAHAACSADDVEDVSDRNAGYKKTVCAKAARLTHKFTAADTGTGGQGNVGATDRHLRSIDTNKAFALRYRGGKERENVSARVCGPNDNHTVAAVDGAREHVRDRRVENASVDKCFGENESNAANLDDRPGSGDGRKHDACGTTTWKIDDTDEGSRFVSTLREQAPSDRRESGSRRE